MQPETPEIRLNQFMLVTAIRISSFTWDKLVQPHLRYFRYHIQVQRRHLKSVYQSGRDGTGSQFVILPNKKLRNLQLIVRVNYCFYREIGGYNRLRMCRESGRNNTRLILVGNPLETQSVGRQKRKLENDIKMVSRGEGYGGGGAKCETVMSKKLRVREYETTMC